MQRDIHRSAFGKDLLFVVPRFHTNMYPLLEALIEHGHRCMVLAYRTSASERHGRSRVFVRESFLSCYLPDMLRRWLAMGSLREVLWVLAWRPVHLIVIKELLGLHGLLIFVLGRLFQPRAIVIIDTQHPQRYPRWALRLMRACGVRCFVTPLCPIPRHQFAGSGMKIKCLPFTVDGFRSLVPCRQSSSSTLRLITVGKFVRRKNHLVVLGAVRRARDVGVDVSLLIVGEATLPAHRKVLAGVRAEIDRLGLSGVVSIQINHPPTSMQELYSRADVYVLGSAHEPAAVSHLEAMAAGLIPIVTTQNGTCGYAPDVCVVKHSFDDVELETRICKKIIWISGCDRRGLLGECRSRIEKRHKAGRVVSGLLALIDSTANGRVASFAKRNFTATPICHVITGLHDGGAEAVLSRVCQTTQRLRHVVISLIDGGGHIAALRSRGVIVHSLGLKRGRINFSSFVRLCRLLRRYRPSIVQTWMYHADLLGGLAAVWSGYSGVVWGVRHSDLNPRHTRLTTRIISLICARLSCRVPRRIIVCGQAAAKAHESLGYACHLMRVIPNGYDFSRFRPNVVARLAVRSLIDADADLPVIGMVARYDSQKDHASLIHALGLVRALGIKFKVVLAGTGIDPGNAMIVRLLQRAGIADTAHLLGRQDDVAALMNGLDIHVLSSLSEGFPNVVAEAMACGTPCVVTDVGESAAIVDSTGWVVPRCDAQALAHALAQALRELSEKQKWCLRQEMACARIRERFSVERMGAAYVRVWREALTRPAV